MKRDQCEQSLDMAVIIWGLIGIRGTVTVILLHR